MEDSEYEIERRFYHRIQAKIEEILSKEAMCLGLVKATNPRDCDTRENQIGPSLRLIDNQIVFSRSVFDLFLEPIDRILLANESESKPDREDSL